jgi:O-antigen/teichoic acid export membrane protein
MSGVASVAMLVAMVLVRMAALLALMKFLAVQFGADGFGQLSQILAVGSLFSVLAGGGLTNGIVRNLATSENSSERLVWIKAALPIATASAVALALVAWLLHETAASALFPGQDLGFVLFVIALSQAVVGFGNVAHAYLSGTQNIAAYSIANGLGTVAAAALVALLSTVAGFRGAAAGCAAMALTPALVAMLAAARSIDWRELGDASFDRIRAVTLLRFGGSTYLAAIAVPLVWVYVRSDLASRQGWEAVGLWQSVMRISDAYMQVFGVIFMNFALPRLAAAPPAGRLRRLRQTALLIFAPFVSGASVLYFYRETLLGLAFSSAFADAVVYLLPQIVGDAFKLGSLLVVYYLMSLNRASVQAAMELLQAAVMLVTYGALVDYLADLAAVASYTVATSVVLIAACGFAAITRRRSAALSG